MPKTSVSKPGNSFHSTGGNFPSKTGNVSGGTGGIKMSEQEFKQLKESLKPIFRDYRRIDAAMEKRLKKLGFGIVRYKNHYIMNYYLCGKELRFEVDKTPGDCRSGIKTVKDISNVILRSGLVYSN